MPLYNPSSGGSSLSKASGAEVVTGTDDAKYVTAKSLADAYVQRGVKRYVALLTQTTSQQSSGSLIVGHSYTINTAEAGDDFTNVGAPDNNQGTTFTATSTTPTNYTNGSNLVDNTLSAPVATVLENTLGGAVVWEREGAGYYGAHCTSAFTENKTFMPNFLIDAGLLGYVTAVGNWVWASSSEVELYTQRAVPSELGAAINFNAAEDNILESTPIEIRVYP